MANQNPSIPISTHETTQTTSTTRFSFKVILQKVKTNLVLRSKWGELNGAMGDLGTFIPITLSLTLSRDLNLGTTLIFTGIYNIITGAIYGVPMPVQPMKSIAAEALSDSGFGVAEIMAAGILTGVVLFLLGVTRLMQLVYTLIPLCVVRGIQLAQGLSFAFTAVNGAGEKDQCDGESESLGKRVEEARNMRKNRVRRLVFSLPSAFIVFMLGVVLAFIRRPKVVHEVKFGPSSMEVVKFSKHAWKKGFVKGTIPQLPLSILNSVIAVCKLSKDLFPEREFSATSLSVSVGLMNLVGSWFGAMPCCHGAGGLAGQYKFGGRSGGCVALLGVAKLVLGLVLGTSLAHILRQFPVGILGVLLLSAGIELATCCRDIRTKEDSFVMLVCTAFSLVGSSAALGFSCGMAVYVLIKLRSWTINDKPFSTIWVHKSSEQL
ncbi:Molybdate transporter 1 [Glycine max]|nr:Molybdate transporter 1 [Glycine max]